MKLEVILFSEIKRHTGEYEAFSIICGNKQDGKKEVSKAEGKEGLGIGERLGKMGRKGARKHGHDQCTVVHYWNITKKLTDVCN